MKFERSSGLLMHITSLPGKHGIGTMGREAFDFIDQLVKGGQKYWQILPVGPVSPIFGHSPYSSASSFAGNYLFINFELLQKEEWMRNYILSDLPEDAYGDFVNFDRVIAFKLPLLRKFAANFFKYADLDTMEEYNRFYREEKYWLDDYALYMSVSEYYHDYNWITWDPEIRMRTPEGIREWSEKLKNEIDYFKFEQYIFFKQWSAVKKYANEKGIKIIGDIPIYVTFDSADTWAHTEIFQLNKKMLRPKNVAGVPPDYFSKTGQRWGNPLYVWREKNSLKKETMDWWIKRFRRSLELYDIVRIDHFRGFESYWSIPAEEKTAINGSWQKGPGIAFFKKLKEGLGTGDEPLPVIAEDLGVITPEVEQLREDLGLPGMKILQFAFDFSPKNPYLPHNYKNTNYIVYTGTHDNNTTNGWFYENETNEETRQYIIRLLGLEHQHEFHWQLIREALGSIADLSIFPIQDILGYAGKFRMNTPGKTHHNWAWKLTPGRFTPKLMDKLRSLCELYNRV